MLEIINTLEKELCITGSSRSLESNLKIDKSKKEYSVSFIVYLNDVPIKETSNLSEAYDVYGSIELLKIKMPEGTYSYSSTPLRDLPEVDTSDFDPKRGDPTNLKPVQEDMIQKPIQR